MSEKYPPQLIRAMAEMLLHDIPNIETLERLEWAMGDVLDVVREHGFAQDPQGLQKKLARAEELLESAREISWQRAQELLELKRK